MNFTRRTFLATTAATVCAHAVSSAFAAIDNSPEPVFEFRQYTLYGGKRDTLVALFEKEFIEPQNSLGAYVLGSFRDLDDPDRFVWIRGFRDMPARKQALEAFYSGPVWQAHKKEANVTMVDSDNVLLLRPAAPGSGLPLHAAAENSPGIYTATIHYLGDVNPAQFSAFFDATMLPSLTAAGVHPIARLVTEDVPNNYPRLPVREHDHVFVWLARFSSLADCDAFLAHAKTSTGWRDSAPASVLPALMQKPERLRLAPTSASQMQ